jgi:hypothetical protein
MDPDSDGPIQFQARISEFDPGPIEPLPALPAPTDPTFESILRAKLDLCDVLCDCQSRAHEKFGRAKEQALSEFVRFLKDLKERNGNDFNPRFQRGLFLMVCHNVLTANPSKCPSHVQTDDYAIPILDPAWGHLSLCYHILALLLSAFPSAEFINLPFVAKLLPMVRLPDSRERAAIVAFLKLYWDIRATERRAMLLAIGNQFAAVRETILPTWTSAALLPLARHALCTSPPDWGESFLELYVNAIVPLVVSAHLRRFLNELKDYMADFHRAWPEFRVLSLWHIQKECALVDWSVSQWCVDLIVSIVVGLDRRLFAMMAPCFFAWFADLLALPNFHVALTVLGIIVRGEHQAFVRGQASAIIHRCYGAITVLAQEHWQCEVRARAEEALKLLTQFNPAEMMLEQRRKLAEVRSQHGRRAWVMIASSVDWEEFGGSQEEEEVNRQIAALYESGAKTRMNSKFMPGPREVAGKDLYTEAFKKISPKMRYS